MGLGLGFCPSQMTWLLFGVNSNFGTLGGSVSKVRRRSQGSETYHGTLTDGKLVWDDGAVWVRVGISDQGGMPGMQGEDDKQRRVSESDFIRITPG